VISDINAGDNTKAKTDIGSADLAVNSLKS